MADAGQRRAAGRPIVIVSNRGPVAFSIDEQGKLTSRRGAGGLVSGIGPLVAGTDATWIAAAISDGDRQAATRGVLDAEGFSVQTLALDPDDFRMAYDVVCNAGLWFAHHEPWANHSLLSGLVAVGVDDAKPTKDCAAVP